jgi:hypothetical protein
VVLNLSKLEAGEMPLTPAAFDLADLVKETVSQLCPWADEGSLPVALRLGVHRGRIHPGGRVEVRVWTSDDTAVLEGTSREYGGTGLAVRPPLSDAAPVSKGRPAAT